MLKMDAYIFICLVLVLSFAETSGQCPENYYSCDQGRTCISLAKICDGIANCQDQSDEICEEPQATEDSDGKSAAVAAARYLISEMQPGGFDDFAPRTAIALSFLGELSPLTDDQKQALVQKLKIQLLMLLGKGVKSMPLHTLALYINSLYASCEDPRSFLHDMDLVEVLRVNTDQAKGKFNLPVVILTLCLAKEVRFKELTLLIKMYDDQRNFRIGTKALTMIVMAACHRQGTAEHYNEMRKRKEDFLHRFQSKKSIGAYSKALIYQMYNAWGLDASELRSELLMLQADDGSFQDALATYAAIPALMNSSLADLQCKTRVYLTKSKRRTGTAIQLFNPRRYIEYTLSMPYGQENVGNHSLTIYYEGRKSFFEIMKTAESLNRMFRFTFDEVEDSGIKVTSLGGVSNDAESGLGWTLYKRTTDQSTDNPSSKDTIESGDIDFVFPQDGEHYIFKLEYGKI